MTTNRVIQAIMIGLGWGLGAGACILTEPQLALAYGPFFWAVTVFLCVTGFLCLKRRDD